MMRIKNFLPKVMLAAFALIIFSAFMLQKAGGPWAVPEKYQKMKNPVAASDKEALSVGKSLYGKHCQSCHGKKGLGDGTKAAQLKTKCGNFSTAEFHDQTDGALFYKISEGRDDMPSFKKKIPDDSDIWSIIHYLRTMKK